MDDQPVNTAEARGRGELKIIRNFRYEKDGPCHGLLNTMYHTRPHLQTAPDLRILQEEICVTLTFVTVYPVYPLLTNIQHSHPEHEIQRKNEIRKFEKQSS